MKRTLLSFLIILCTALAIQAQPAPVYTLKSCLEQGLLNNYSLRITRNEQQVSKNNATLANAGYLPTLDLSAGIKVLWIIPKQSCAPPVKQPKRTVCSTRPSMPALT